MGDHGARGNQCATAATAEPCNARVALHGAGDRCDRRVSNSQVAQRFQCGNPVGCALIRGDPKSPPPLVPRGPAGQGLPVEGGAADHLLQQPQVRARVDLVQEQPGGRGRAEGQEGGGE